MEALHRRLSKQEESVLSLASAGLGDKEIAVRLQISVDTVRTYWQRIRAKLEVTTRAEAAKAVTSRDLGLILEATGQENKSLLDEVGRRRNAEELLAESEARFRYLCQGSPQGIFMADPSGACTYANPACVSILGCDEASLMGSGWRRFLRDPSLLRKVRTASISVNRAAWHLGECTLVRPDGKARLIRVTLQRVTPHAGHGGYIGLVDDLTRSRELERDCDELKRFAECVSAATEDLVFVYDIATETTVYTNHVAESLFGMSCSAIREMGANAMAHFIDVRDHPTIAETQAQYAVMADSDSILLQFRTLPRRGVTHRLVGRLMVFRRDPFGLPRQMIGVLRVFPAESTAAA